MQEEIKQEQANKDCIWQNKDLALFVVIGFGVGFFFGTLCMAQ